MCQASGASMYSVLCTAWQWVTVACARQVERGANVDARFQAGFDDHDDGAANRRDTCLHVAAADGRLACIQVLVEAGAKLDVVNQLGQTPLHEAVRHGHNECALELIAAGASLGVADKEVRPGCCHCDAHAIQTRDVHMCVCAGEVAAAHGTGA